MQRSQFLRLLTAFPVLKKANGIEWLLREPGLLAESERMPVFFTGHLDTNQHESAAFITNLRAMGRSVKPSVILVISAHSLTAGDSYVTVNERFFVPHYPVIGSPSTADYLVDHAKVQPATWELDHGAWMVLKHIAPEGNIPVLQLSLDITQSFDYHYHLARQLVPLRDKGVLIIGSGNVVHNLELSVLRFWTDKPYQWAVDFDSWVKERIDDRDWMSLFSYEKAGKAARLSVPTTDHYLPLLYSLSLTYPNEPITHTYESVFKGLSLRCLRIG